jgi:hypothetical protein
MDYDYLRIDYKTKEISKMDMLDKVFQSSKGNKRGSPLPQNLYGSMPEYEWENYGYLVSLDKFAFSFNYWLVERILNIAAASCRNPEEYMDELRQTIHLHERMGSTYKNFFQNFCGFYSSPVSREMYDLQNKAIEVQTEFVTVCKLALSLLSEDINSRTNPDKDKLNQYHQIYQVIPGQLEEICTIVNKLRNEYQVVLSRPYPYID